jgi:putative FmdB family regulatory protein
MKLMPIYEYRCEKCGGHFEVIQKLSDSPLKTCSSCKGRLTKLISQTSFQLKGSGWYVTDYAGKSKSSGKSEEASKPADASKTSSDSTAKTEPAPKNDSNVTSKK